MTTADPASDDLTYPEDATYLSQTGPLRRTAPVAARPWWNPGAYRVVLDTERHKVLRRLPVLREDARAPGGCVCRF
jgi:hypothetical protein